MRASITTWVIAAMVAVPSAAFASGPSGSLSSGSVSTSSGLIVNMNLNNLVSPAILNNTALSRAAGGARTGSSNFGPSVDIMRPVGIGPDAFQNQEYHRRGKRDGADKLDITDRKDGKMMEAVDKAGGKKSDAVTRVVANTEDDSPSQQSAMRANTPPPTCR